MSARRSRGGGARIQGISDNDQGEPPDEEQTEKFHLDNLSNSGVRGNTPFVLPGRLFDRRLEPLNNVGVNAIRSPRGSMTVTA
jgi:hypothetical protein